MLGSRIVEIAYEEGVKARKAGLSIDDNPYNFITETMWAYAWEGGFKNGF